MNRKARCYSFIFPFWLLILKPSWLWISLLPLNIAWDGLVLLLSLKLLRLSGVRMTWKKAILKVCLLGFLIDCAAAALLLFSHQEWNGWWKEYIAQPMALNPYDNWYALFYTIAVILCAGLLIYFLNRHITFRRIDLESFKKRIVYLLLAVFTAPYFLLIPAGLFSQPAQTLYCFTNHIVPAGTELVQVSQYSEGKETAEANVYMNELLTGAVNHASPCAALPGELEKASYRLRFLPGQVDVWLYRDSAEEGGLYFTYEGRVFRPLAEDEGPLRELLDSLIESGFAYHYILVDQSVLADDALELIAKDETYGYYLSSVRSNHIILCFDNGEVLSLPEALEIEIVDIYDLIRNGLDVIALPLEETNGAERIEKTEIDSERDGAGGDQQTADSELSGPQGD